MSEEIKKKGRGRPKGSGSGKNKGGNETVIIDPLLNPYKIYVDDNCYTIVDKDKPVTNSTIQIEKPYGYYTSLGGALTKIIKMKMVSNKTYSISEYIKEYKEMTESFRSKFNF